jgi:hypothetical protein
MKQLLTIIILFIIIFGLIYHILNKNHFANYNSVVDGFYVSMGVLSTCGYGEVLPTSLLAKLVIMIQQFITILIYLHLFFV